MSKPISPEKRGPKCAQCGKKPIVAEYRPFCSKRCADVDLNQWLKGGYAIPGQPVDPADPALAAEQSEDNADED
ncbi:DNA gyrase inhibitor YacG [Hyphomonas johnsonii]|uniref:DNA gyrase inhibitor YacG n=1 Tax=Hyphomonas johnsonii MHS-2 TaxID=1280950 RepID=A0A059FUE7_9PROT|nr:DNA gyrase inhibitor YacG [Hyphomonas johnsonii]KCZ94330.1 hypothetical protein HJO_03110 [Hyphomonas johnsonii MHS-2]